MARAVIRPLIEQHAEDAAFLWLLRDAASRAAHYSLADLAKLDGRLEAQLDALRLDPGLSWRICTKVLKLDEAGEVFAASILALEHGQTAEIEKVVDAGTAIPSPGRGLVSALGWLPHQRVAPLIKKLLAAESSDHRRIGIAAAAVHRQVPHQSLLNALGDRNPALRARASRAVGEMGLLNLHQSIRRDLGSDDTACQFWAAWSSALIVGDRDGLTRLRAFAEGDGPFAERALQLAMRRMDEVSARAWQQKLAWDPVRARRPVVGAGAIGDPEFVPWLIEQMKVPELARVAGEAFAMITGVDIAYEDLEAEKPEGFEAGPTEDPEDEDVAMDPDENLPWPDPVAIKKWWEGHRGGFSTGTRYLLGQPIGPESLQRALRDGRQRQRSAAALELAIRNPGQPLFEVRAPGFRQQELLGGAGA